MLRTGSIQVNPVPPQFNRVFQIKAMHLTVVSLFAYYAFYKRH